jgi:hypothetical protein
LGGGKGTNLRIRLTRNGIRIRLKGNGITLPSYIQKAVEAPKLLFEKALQGGRNSLDEYQVSPLHASIRQTSAPPPLFPKGKREGGDKRDELRKAFHSKMTTF